MTFRANPIGAQVIHPCNKAFNDHLQADEAVRNFLAFDDSNFVSFRGQDHPASAAAQQT
jgi:hypothetical protein